MRLFSSAKYPCAFRVAIVISLIALLFFRVIAPWSAAFSLGSIRYFDQDEFQHSQAAWNVASGLIPYKDFFEHHPPLLYFHLAPIVSYFKPEISPDSAVQTLKYLRKTISLWVASLLIVLIGLAYKWIGGRAGWLVGIGAASFLSSLSVFWEKMIEIRPDAPAVCLSLSGLLFLLTGLQTLQKRSGQEKLSSLMCSYSGLMFGGMSISCAVLFTHKILFLGPGIFCFWLFYLFDDRWGLTFKMRLLAVCCSAIGFIIPFILIALWFGSKDALGGLYFYNITVNFNWQNHFSSGQLLKVLWWDNIFFSISSLLGLVIVSFRALTKSSIQRGDLLLVMTTVSAVAGVLIVPEPYLQYHQHFIALLSLFASAFCYMLTKEIIKILYFRYKIFRYTPIRCPAALVCIILLYYITPPANSLNAQTQASNRKQLETLIWILSNATSSDSVFEDFPLSAAFRKQIWFYGVLHGPIMNLISNRSKAQLSQDLMSAKIKPKIIEWNRFVNRMPEDLQIYLKRNYVRANENYWIRREIPE